MTPDSARNIDFVSAHELDGHGDCVQIMVHKGHAFIGHMFSDGFSIVDVRDAKRPRLVKFVAAPPNTRAFHLQTHGDLLLTVNSPNIWVMQGYSDPNDYFKASITDTFTKRDKSFSAGLRVYDISNPADPREIAFMPVDGLGLHRLWYVGGRYAYASCHWQGFTDHVLAIIDMQDPTRPAVVGRFWLPGMNQAAGEIPSWSGKRYALHHAIVAGNLAYAAWRDGGMTILDVADPTAPKLLSHRNWSPPFGGGTHTPLPLPDRNLAVYADEGNLDDCANGIQRCWVFDVRDPTNPVSISTLPTPSEADYCAKGAKFGPHNLHENRPGSMQTSDLIFGTYQNAGVRVFDIRDAFHPREVAHFVPPAPERMVDPRPNRPRVIQSNDVYVAPDGLMYLTDVNTGLTILQYKGWGAVSLDDLKPGLRQSRMLTVSEALAVPAQAAIFDPTTEMPPVFATAQMIAFVEWTCVVALAPYLGPEQRTVGTRVEMTHTAATPIGMTVTAEVELVAFEGRTLRFKVNCHDESDLIGDGFHERAIIDYDRFMARLARKTAGG